MRLQKVAKSAGGLALGALVVTLLYRWDELPLREGQGSTALQEDTQANFGELQAPPVERISEYPEPTLNADDLASDSSEPGAPRARTDAEVEEFQSFLANASAEARTMAGERDVKRLLEAGFSRERIDWLRARTEALKAARKQDRSDSDPHMSAAYILDGDLDLVNEIGEEEYDRYRQALGRPSGVSIAEVPVNSGLQAYGIEPGDSIVRVNGTRTYNGFMLNRAASDSSARSNVVVEVMRGGQTFPVTVPSGSLSSLRTEAPGAARLRNLRPPPADSTDR